MYEEFVESAAADPAASVAYTIVGFVVVIAVVVVVVVALRTPLLTLYPLKSLF